MTGYARSITRVIFILIVIAALTPMGCQHQRDYGMRPNSNPIQDEFAAGKDRAPTAQTLYAMARLLVARNRDAQAEYVLLHLNDKHASFVPAYIDLAELYMRRDMTAEAMATLEKGLDIDPGNAVLHNNMGVCLMVSEDYAGALERFTAACDAAPTVRRYNANRGVTMALMGDYDNALDVFMRSHTHKDAHYNLAMICRANGDEERADRELRLSKDLDHEHE